MGKTKAVVEVLDASTSPHNARLAQLGHFFDRMNKTGAAEFTSELGIVRDGVSRLVLVRPAAGTAVVAYALFRMVRGSDAELDQLYSEVKGRGYGRSALRGAEDAARALGARTMALDAVPRAVPFYLKLGYSLLGGDRQLMFKRL